MLDALTMGYIIPLWADVQVSNTANGPEISWRMKKAVFEEHLKDGMHTLDGYGNYQFKFLNQWIPKLPKGYSLLVTSPIGYPNLPFKTFTAIVDYDKTPHVLFPPVMLKNGFEGIVEKGTPMAQIFPFKRDNWKSTFSHLEDGELKAIMDRDTKATIVNNYVTNFWQKKTFR
jgi:hypothetical protein